MEANHLCRLPYLSIGQGSLQLASFLKQQFRHAFLRFLLNGAVNTIFGYSVFAVLVYAGLGPQFALILTTCIGVLFNFVTARNFVFGRTPDRLTFFRFICAYVLTYVFNAAALEFLMSVLGISPYGAQILLVPITAVMTFLLMRNWVFKVRKGQP